MSMGDNIINEMGVLVDRLSNTENQSMLFQGFAEFNGPIASLVTDVLAPALQSLGFALLTIFFLIELYGQMRADTIGSGKYAQSILITMVIKLCVLTTILAVLPSALVGSYDLAAYVNEQLNQRIQVHTVTLPGGMSTTVKDAVLAFISEEVEDLGLIDGIFPYLIVFFASILSAITNMLCYFVMFGRHIEFALAIVFAPIALGFLPAHSSGESQVAKNYIKYIFALALQAVVLYVIYTLLPSALLGVFQLETLPSGEISLVNAGSVTDIATKILCYCVMAIFLIMGSGRFAKRILHVN